MDFLEGTLTAGLFLVVISAVLIVVAVLRVAKQTRASGHRAQIGERQDIYLGVLWTGLLLMQLSSLIRQMESPNPHSLSLLSVAGFASAVFLCGGFAGRLTLRMELRRRGQSAAPG